MSTQPELAHENDVWIIRLLNDKGRIQEYRCANESQARALLLVLCPKPSQPSVVAS